MRSVKIAYREPAIILTVCEFGACFKASSICGSFEGITETDSVEAVLCSLDCSEAA